MNKKPIQFYTLEDKKDILEREAVAKGITLTALINIILDEYIKQNKLATNSLEER